MTCYVTTNYLLVSVFGFRSVNEQKRGGESGSAKRPWWHDMHASVSSWDTGMETGAISDGHLRGNYPAERKLGNHNILAGARVFQKAVWGTDGLAQRDRLDCRHLFSRLLAEKSREK